MVLVHKVRIPSNTVFLAHPTQENISNLQTLILPSYVAFEKDRNANSLNYTFLEMESMFLWWEFKFDKPIWWAKQFHAKFTFWLANKVVLLWLFNPRCKKASFFMINVNWKKIKKKNQNLLKKMDFKKNVKKGQK